MPFARRAKRDPGGHGDVGLLQESIGGLSRGHAGSTNVGECVERALDQRTADAIDRIQSFCRRVAGPTQTPFAR